MAPDENAAASSYIQTIDLTSRTQKQQRREEVGTGFQEPDPPLPSVTVDTLPDMCQQACLACGWTALMDVQQKAIPYLLDRRDMIVQSQTGSGKTGAFLLPLFDILDPSEREAQALILTPTRELARQIDEEFERMKLATPETNELDAALLYGGVAYGPQIDALNGGAQVVIGTPGRTLDHIKKRNFRTQHVSVFTLDEADEMLSMGFYPDMLDIMGYLPDDRTTFLFSATMPAKVRTLARELQRNPGFLSLSSGGREKVEEIDYRYYLVNPMEKDETLAAIIEHEEPDSAIIFCNTKRNVSYLNKFLSNRGYDADEISGDLSQTAREKAMDRIRDGALRFLVATDVAARGIDITDLSHVFMYDVPQDREYLLHRSGRTARAGKKGRAIILTTHEDEFELLRMTKRYGIDIEKGELEAEVATEEAPKSLAETVTDALEARYALLRRSRRATLDDLADVVRTLATDRPELLAMLVEEEVRGELEQLEA
jgi:ATP-dependent RNA helicase DeaD